MNKSVGIYIYIANSLGGAERRLIRIFSTMPQTVHAEILIIGNSQERIRDLIAPFTNKNSHVIIFSNMLQLLVYVKREKFDWVAGFTAGGRFILLSMWAMLWGIKRLFLSVETSSSSLIFSRNLRGVILKYKYYSCIKLSTLVDCLYPSATLLLQKSFPKQRFSTTKNSFTDLSIFKPSNEKEKLIVFASTFIVVKNPDLFVEAIAMVQNQIRKLGYKCFLCGDGPMAGELRKQVIGLGCSDVIEFPGRVAMEQILPQTKFFCSLQSVTNYPSQALIEAIACGCYCIATDCGDTKLLIKSDFGRLVSFNPQSIAEAILDAIRYSDQSQDCIIETSRKFALRECDITVSVHYYEKLLCEN